MDFKTVPIKLSDEIKEVMENAETTGKKLYIEGEEHYLAKKRLNKFTPNVEYIIADGEVEVVNLYSYIISFADPKGE